MSWARAGAWVVIFGGIFGSARSAHAQAAMPPPAMPPPAMPPPAMPPPAMPPPALPRDFDSGFVLGASAPPDVRRTIEERGFAALPVMVELRGGFGTIVGLFGATMSFDPISRLSLGVGFGANTSGAQFAAFARVRPLVFTGKRWARLHAVGLELGYSTGPFRDFIAPAGDGPDESLSTFSYDRVQWLQPQVTYETRSYRGFNVLGGLGVEIPIARRGYECLDATRCGSNHLTALPTVTVGIGWALGL